MLLFGSWCPTNPADQSLFSRLGVSYQDLERQCEQVALGPEPPVVREQNHWGQPRWRWTQLGAAWSWLARRLDRSLVDGFEAAILAALGRRDPRLGLSQEERLSATIVASLQGQPPGESGWLREGLARSLVYLAENDNQLATLHDVRRGRSLARSVVRQLLAPDWASWVSLADVLPLLAEAAPDEFLDRLEHSLGLGPAGVARMLTEEGPRGASHTGLLWALETLAWSVDHMPRAALALARLAQLDRTSARPGRVANRPEASLLHLLDFRFAQTKAPLETRLAILDRILLDYPDVGESLILAQFQSLTLPGLLHPSRTPQVRDLQVMSHEDLFARALHETSQNLDHLLASGLRHAGAHADRWVRLLQASRQLPDALARQLLTTLEDSQPSFAGDPEIWAALRQRLRWLLRRTQGGDELQVPQNQRLYDKFAPADDAIRIAWLFAPAPMPPVNIDDWQAEQDHIKILRAGALSGLWQQENPRAALDRLVSAVSAPWVLGETLGEMPFAAELETDILQGPPDGPLATLAIGFVSALWARRSDDWDGTALGHLIGAGRVKEAARICYSISMAPGMWDVVARFGEPLWSAYWQQIQAVSQDLPPSALERAITNLLHVESGAVALETAAAAVTKLDTSLLLEVLAEVSSSPEQMHLLAGRTSTSFWLERLFDELVTRGDIDRERATRLELKFLPWLGESPQPARFVGQMLGSRPADFAELLGWIYQRDGELSPPPGPELEEHQRRAEAAHKIIDAWQGYPGDTQPAPEQQKILEWSLTVLQLASESGREAAARMEVAKVLARVPRGEDGIWPCLAARDLVERDGSRTLAKYLAIAKFNLRGMTTRKPGDGGRQEHEIAICYLDDASKIAIRWPVTASMLRSMAEDYEQTASEQDAGALAALRQEGLDTDDLPAVARYLAPQDVVLALWLSMNEETWRRPQAAMAMKQDDQELNASLLRLRVARMLVGTPGRGTSNLHLDRPRLVDLLIQESRTAFPAQKGDLSRGVPTGIMATPLRASMTLGSEDLLVWPTQTGTEEGRSLQPLSPAVPELSIANGMLHVLFALVDVLRTGHARERKLASARLRSLLLDTQTPERQAS
jgi:hypothetical protein